MRSSLLILLLLFACRGERAGEMEQVAKETLSAVRAKELVKVQVRLEKPEPPSAADLELRKKIEDRIQQEDVGTITESTTDAGHYDLTIEVASTNESIPRVRAILRDAGVAERSTVRVETKQ
ncbi:MAG TPA: hypothetical protein VHW00_16920 [Thermoanaerobaculia bacterium]|nr:hypothetical protein [Thermoanaerobaculia bacterium]